MATTIDSLSAHLPECRHVLVAAEGGVGLRPLARCAMKLASPDASLHLAAVSGDPVALYPWISLRVQERLDAHKAMRASSRAALDAAARQLAERNITPDTVLLDLSTQHASAAQAVGALASHSDVSLIAITAFDRSARGRGIWHIDPEELAATSACPVLYVPYACLEDGRTRLTKVMVGLDGSRNALDALTFALERVPRDALIQVVYVVDHALGLRHAPLITSLMKEGMRVLSQADALLKKHGRVGATTMIGTSTSARTISESIAHEAARWHADLVVLGSRGRSPLSRWLLGSVAERTLRDAKQSVLIVPAFDDRAALRELAGEMTRDTESVLAGAANLPPIFL